MVKLLSSTGFSSFTREKSFWPIASLGAQRCSEAMQSAEVTGAPSWNLSPSRRVKV
jgi:hypothetical protein